MPRDQEYNTWIFTDVEGLIVNGKELELKDFIGESKPDIIRIVKTKHIEEIGSHLVFAKGFTVVWKEKLDTGGGELAL